MDGAAIDVNGRDSLHGEVWPDGKVFATCERRSASSTQPALFTELEEISLDDGETGLAVGGLGGTAGLLGIGALPHLLDATVGRFLDVLLDFLGSETETAAKRGIEVFGVDGVCEEGDLGDSLEVIEVSDLAGGVFAEDGGIAEDRGPLRGKMSFERGSQDWSSERTTTGTARIAGRIEFFDEGFVHARGGGGSVPRFYPDFPAVMSEESELEEGLGLHDGKVFRKGMKRMDKQAARGVLDLDEADGDGRPAGGGGEMMRHEGLMAVVEQFLVKMEKDFRFQLFKLEADVIFEPGLEADRFLAVSLEFLAVEFFPDGEGGLTRGSDFAEDLCSAAKGDGVPRVTHLEAGGISFLDNFRLRFGVEQLGVNRTSEDLKDQVGNVGSDITETHTRGPWKTGRILPDGVIISQADPSYQVRISRGKNYSCFLFTRMLASEPAKKLPFVRSNRQSRIGENRCEGGMGKPRVEIRS